MIRHPLIGVSPNAFPAEDRRFYKNKPLEYGDASIATAVRAAGGLPLMLYRAGTEGAEALAAQADAMVARVDGLVLTGGADISPGTYGEEALDPAWRGDPDRDRWEMALYRAAVAHQRPVLGVCRGAQLINVAEGGSLWQDLATLRDGSKVHRSQELYDSLSHDVAVEAGTELEALFGDDSHHVNSVHHQGLKAVAPSLRVIAHSPDGVPEAVVREGEPWVLGVQWHPEWMQDRPAQRRIFERLVELAQSSAQR
ncbi:MAG: gamma-glutamyl-gamma-aminobutyrate hydrolase family protein [Deltaproteobacteria bacterium]|nr:gamma-glutamyl-gamma-aminobutyrate hydrolase family protein [Deltaproteobacteria bacterium]MCB9786532.1 gamma-glutamyl-gamma-aminobutyrate hydrolase family protein [Deltaproteobacteria bacterium]